MKENYLATLVVIVLPPPLQSSGGTRTDAQARGAGEYPAVGPH